LFLFQPTNAQICITTLSLSITFIPSCFDISVSSSETSKLTTATRDCICSRKNTLLAKCIIMSHRIYCITQWWPNNILIYLNLIILWNCNFNSLNFKNICNLLRHKFLNSLRMKQRCWNLQEWTLYEEIVLWYISVH
jgi:hypothetical protein